MVNFLTSIHKENQNDDDIVISGIAGRFPNSRNVREFAENLYGKVNMTDEEETRWPDFSEELPKRCGKISDVNKFDAAFFSMLAKHVDWTDPQIRMLLEDSYEAILDAGISPQSLAGSRTGVFVGCTNFDAKLYHWDNIQPKEGYGILGNAHYYLANKISYALGLCGPSFMLDTACSSSGHALFSAFNALKLGSCDAALVGGTQLNLHSRIVVDYMNLGVLAIDGISRPFDENASGFVRGEANCMMFLQRRKDAKRVYADVLHINCNNDGYKMEGSTFPSRHLQQHLMEEFYERIKIDPRDVNFVEAHATSTKLGDPEEVAAIDEVFCKKTKRRSELVIGSVKSNMGHAESAAGMASIAKILIAFENQKFPPNINFSTPRSNVPAFEERRIRVATEAEELNNSQLIAMNSFGLGGANAHALFRGNPKKKVNFGIPSDNLGRMVLWSGRTEAAVNAIFDDIASRPLDAEHIALLQNSQVQTTSANIYRGFGVFAHDAGVGRAVCTQRDIQHFDGTRRPIVFVFSGIGSQWPGMGRDLMRIPLLAASIERSHEVLLAKNVDLKGILASEDPKTFENILHSYVGILAIEIALTDALKALGIEPDFIVGHSVGELGCAYADNCLTAEETILAALARGEASNEAKNAGGAMAAIGLHHSQLEKMLPPDIDIACHNAKDSTTISGPAQSVRRFVDEMEKQKVFAKEVACSGIPLHSRYINEMGKKLQAKLETIIREPKKRSHKWLSSTFAEEAWSGETAQFSSAAYHTRNLLNPVLFQEVTEMLPKNALTIEIAPHALLKSILKRSLSEGIHTSLTQRGCENGAQLFVESLGRLFQHGVDMDIAQLYPAVSFPVSRNTPMISPVIKWDHKENHFVPFYDSYNAYERRNITINISDKKFEFIQGHVVDGRCLFPAAGWIFLVWETFALMLGKNFKKVKVILEDIRLLRATALSKNQDVFIIINIHRGTGNFEVIEGVSAVVTGNIKQVEKVELTKFTVPKCESAVVLQTKDFYTAVRLRGFGHTGAFQITKEVRSDLLEGKMRWEDNWITFIDNITLLHNLNAHSLRNMDIPTEIKKIVIDPVLHYEMLKEKRAKQEARGEEILFEAKKSPYLNIMKVGGVELHENVCRAVTRKKVQALTLEAHKFVPFFPSEKFKAIDAAKIITQIALESMTKTRFSCLEFDCKWEPFSENVMRALNDTPLVQPDVTVVTSVAANLDFFAKGIKTSTEPLSSFSDVDMIIRSHCMNDEQFLESARKVLHSNGYIISRESTAAASVPASLQLIAQFALKKSEVIYMLQFRDQIKLFKPHNVIEVTSDVDKWLLLLKGALQQGPTLVYAYNRDFSGILGFFNCLRREHPPERLRCIFIMDTASAPTKFDINDEFFKSRLELSHAVNVYKNSKWGGYRFLSIDKKTNQKPQSEHCYVHCLTRGDLSSLKWVRGPLDVNRDDIVSIQYSSLNFKDVMLALGRITPNKNMSIEEQCVVGIEFAGTRQNGQKVMGIAVKSRGIATHYDSKDAILLDAPAAWTLEEAATIPMAYLTVYLSYFSKSRIKRGQSILIHSGSGGVGQAAIQVAFAYGLEVFVTAGSDEKKAFLLDKFPQLKSERISSSRDLSFERMIMESTNGRGVDFVLNSLIGEKLKASMRCLTLNGTLLEIGRYDMEEGTRLSIHYLKQNIKIAPVYVDYIVKDPDELTMIYNLIAKDIKAGIIQPVNSKTFDAGEVEEAFRFMSAGKHIGKILLKVRQNESDKTSLPLEVQDRIIVAPSETVFVAGGLGGMGMRVVDWLVQRGCRKLVLSSRRGFTTQHQKYCVQEWESFGVEVLITTADITTESGCKEVLELANKLGTVTAIYNLAGVLRDGIFGNLNQKMFEESLAPKAKATANLDLISRRLCPHLKHFVVFSSISCGRGNAGQSNYGLSNSVMERIVEERKKCGFPAKAIQWAAVGDVGMLADSQSSGESKDFRGTLAQPIRSCIEVLDELLLCDDVIVSSMIVAEKTTENAGKANVIDAILNIIGIRDRKAVSMDATFAQLGVDSLMSVEIQQILERDYQIILTSQMLRSLTLGQLEVKSEPNPEVRYITQGIDELMMNTILPDGELAKRLSEETLIKLNDIEDTGSKLKVLILPGIFGIASDVYVTLAQNMNFPAYVLQYIEASDCVKAEDMFERFEPMVSKLFNDCSEFIFVAHSFGIYLGLKLAKLFETQGKRGKVIAIDTSPVYCRTHMEKYGISPEMVNSLGSKIFFGCFSAFFQTDAVNSIYEKHENWQNRLEALMKKNDNQIPYTFEFIMEIINVALVNRVQMILDTKDNYVGRLETTKMYLIRAENNEVSERLPEDYSLSNHCQDTIEVTTLTGSHVTVMGNPELIEKVKNLAISV